MLTKDSMKNFRQSSRILFREQNVLYLLPHASLRTWISNYTITFPQAAAHMSEQYTVIPHGCATLVFSIDSQIMSGNLFGPMTKPSCVGHAANSLNMLFIIEFQPAGYYAFSNIPQKELTDRLLPFHTLNSALEHDLTCLLEDASEINCFINNVDSLLLHYLKSNPYPQEFQAAMNLILDNKGMVSVKELSQSIYYSERHLGRIFHTYMGISTKSFSRLVRLNTAIHLLRRSDTNILQTGMESGFYDNSHFIHDFTSICGVSPQQYREHMSDFYIEMAKF